MSHSSSKIEIRHLTVWWLDLKWPSSFLFFSTRIVCIISPCCEIIEMYHWSYWFRRWRRSPLQSGAIGLLGVSSTPAVHLSVVHLTGSSVKEKSLICHSTLAAPVSAGSHPFTGETSQRRANLSCRAWGERKGRVGWGRHRRDHP